MFFCSRPENPLFPGRSRVMPAPVLPGHPGLHARDQAPDRRTMNKNGAAPLQESRPSPVRPAPHGRLHRTFRQGTAYGAQGQIAHLSSGSKQNLQKEGDRPDEERISKEDTSLPGSRKPCKTAPPDADKGPSCPGPPAGCRKRRGTVPSPLPFSGNGKRDPFRSPSIFQISPGCGLPAGFTHTGQFAAQGHVAEADTADAELAHEGPGTPADGATIVGAGAELGLTGSLHFKSGTGHSSTPTCGTACPAGPEGTCLPCPWSPR